MGGIAEDARLKLLERASKGTLQFVMNKSVSFHMHRLSKEMCVNKTLHKKTYLILNCSKNKELSFARTMNTM